MADVMGHRPGDFCWPELSTTDPEGASDFYGALFGWEPREIPIGDGMAYTMLTLRGKEVGALCPMQEKHVNQGMPPFWMSYVRVDSADETAARVAALGGRLLSAPFDVMDAGRMAVLEDPTGAALALWQPKAHIGASIVGEPNSLCWSELSTDDVDVARSFYSGLFGWTTKDSPEYHEWMNAGRAIGGMVQLSPETDDTPPHWLPYFRVEDCDATVETAEEEEGQVVVPPMDVPNVGRFAVLRDPQGAVFAVISLQ